MQPTTKIRHHSERSVPDEFQAILKKGLVAHVGFNQEGQPYVIPFSYQYDESSPNFIYLHGPHGSRTLRHLSKGAPVCIAVTLLQGLVYSRTALDHSMNYESVVCFGRAKSIKNDDEKEAILEKMIRRYFPGRTAGRDYEAPSLAHLKSTALLKVEIEARSAKVRCGGPTGPMDAGEKALGSAGVIELNGPAFGS